MKPDTPNEMGGARIIRLIGRPASDNDNKKTAAPANHATPNRRAVPRQMNNPPPNAIEIVSGNVFDLGKVFDTPDEATGSAKPKRYRCR